MDWSKGYSASYYMTRVDPATWRDVERIEITGGQIKRTVDGLMQSADIDCVNLDRLREFWVRVWMNTDQNGAHAHTALFTGLATTPDRDIKGVMFTSTATCYSVLKPADDVILPRGWYAAAGVSGAAIVARLLAVTPAPVEVAEWSPELSGAIIAEDDETNLSMLQKVLDVIDWRLRISGEGVIHVEPKPTAPAVMFDPLENDVIETELTVTADWYECPNVVMVTDDDLTAIARDDSPNSLLSTVNRGREVWQVENGVDLAAGETIAGYARRLLAELQQAEVVAEYDRRFHPDIMPGDMVGLHYPAQGLDGVYTVAEQSIDIAKAGRTSEQVSAKADLTVGDDGKEIYIGMAKLVDDDENYVVSDDTDYVVGLTNLEVK